MNQITWDDAAYEMLLRQLGVRVGLAFRAHQQENMRQGIQRAMGKAGVTDLRRYVARLQHDPQTLEDLIVELTVGETYFFRDHGQFTFIRREILPEIWRLRGPGHTIRMWSAGCASGEEPYSLAMLCDMEGLANNVSILATDVSTRAISLATKGVYRDWSLRGEAGEMAKPYLRREGEFYILDQRIRRLVHFEFLNLALDVYPSYATATMQLDLILCRNVLIYLNQDTICAAARRFYDSLSEGGWLITAASDPPLDRYADFELVVNRAGVFYHKPVGPRARRQESGDRSQAAAVGQQQSKALDEIAPAGEPAPCQTDADRLAAARKALVAGEHTRAVELTDAPAVDEAASAVHIKALANLDTRQALASCREAVVQHPLSTELHYLHAVVSLDVNELDEAVEAARRVIYLDRDSAIAHFTLGSILQRQGKLETARRHFRNANNICRSRPPGEKVPLADGETMAQLAHAAAVQIRSIEAAMERTA